MTITFEEAKQFHAMVETVADDADRNGQGQFVADLWDAATGRTVSGVIADAVRMTVPLDWVPLLVSEDGIPAAYLTATTMRVVRDCQVDISDDFALRTAITAAFVDMEDRRKLANDIESGFGCDDSLAWVTVREVEDEQDPTVVDAMKKIAQLAGRMFDAFRYVQVPRPTDDPEEYCGAKTGGDIDKLLPEEMARLAVPGLDMETAERITTNKALQYRMKGQSTKARGPLVLVLDESESMGDWTRPGVCKPNGRRNVWAKACAVALGRVALLEGRKVRVVHFSNATRVSEIGSDADLIRMARHFMSGGTHIPKAIERGIGQVGDLAKAGFEGADIVLITDGEDNRLQHRGDLFDQMDVDGIKLWSVSIANRQQPGKLMRDRAEKYLHVDDSGLTEDAVTGLSEAALDNHRRLLGTGDDEA